MSFTPTLVGGYLQAAQPMMDALRGLGAEGLPPYDPAGGFQPLGKPQPLPSVTDLVLSFVKAEPPAATDTSAATQYIQQVPDDVREAVMGVLAEHTDSSLQEHLFDLLGYDHFDLIADLVQHRDSIVAALHTPAAAPGAAFMTDAEMKAAVAANHRRTRNEELAPMATTTKYPHVYQSSSGGGTILSALGTGYALPQGTTRESYGLHEEVVMPYPEQHKVEVPLVQVSSLDYLCQGTFKGYSTLNKMQLLVYPVAYQLGENMLVCAPTGAGKTDVAMMTVLQTVGQFVTERQTADGVEVDIDYDEFKIVYVAPLKALAAEIVDKFAKRLAWLGITVKELTGDMQLTRAEILTTQVIVTTPEKWDVVTRKGNRDTELVGKVRLLIIDEVHLLHEDRGSVIETLVARTLRQVESTQLMIRVIGLLATLPNYADVADFLGVNRQLGMFYFDQAFRPCPLQQVVVGVRGKAGSKQARENIDKVLYDKLVDVVASTGKQVMVFVHSRKDTANTARTYISMARDRHEQSLFESTGEPAYEQFIRDVGRSKNKELKELFASGFGVHHAGMLRADRNLTERMFLRGAIKVLVCTATLAWGVNLPASVVIVKGTQLYDPKRGGAVDLGILDVLQIFGRAGRPQFEKYGTGILCTTSDKLDHYLALLTQQHPIESVFSTKLIDNLNAEIALGSVTTVAEGVRWLGYTYMYVRMRQNPFRYGIEWDDLRADPTLGQRRHAMVVSAARRLHALQMIVFDDSTELFTAKDLGRIALDFYLLHNTVEVFGTMMSPEALEADVLGMVLMLLEFDNVRYREDEAKELEQLAANPVCEVPGERDLAPFKTNVLLQAYVLQKPIQHLALVLDSNYVAQNAVRITRALFLIALLRRWGLFARVMLSLCKAIDKRMWLFEHPMHQFQLPADIMRNLTVRTPSMETLRDMTLAELGELVHNKRLGATVYRLVGRFPWVVVEAEIFPVTSQVMRIKLELTPDFVWDGSVHGNVQMFWVMVEELDKSGLLYQDRLMLSRKLMHAHTLDFMIPLLDPVPPQVAVRVVLDLWLGSDSAHAILFQHLIQPHNETIQTKLLRLQPLPVSALKDPVAEAVYSKFGYFNPMQTMVFHALYHQDLNVFVGSPTGSGKTVVAELAIWHALNSQKGSKVVYIAPMKALVRERVDDWRRRLKHLKIVEMTGDSLPEAREVREALIIITTPEKFDGILRSWQTRKFVTQVLLVIMDEIHLLALDRGPILEMIVLRMNYVLAQTKRPVRLLGMSTAVLNAHDMAGWLRVKNGLFNFPQLVRPVPLLMYIDGFPDNLAFCPLMKVMNRPAFMAIKQHLPTKPVLVFVASRRQTRLTALDLIHLCGMEDNPRRFLRMDDNELQAALATVKDDTLRLLLQFGIGLHHAGLVELDRLLSHRLFEQGKIQILVATATLAWGVNLPAYLVIIKGTQFFDAKIEGYRDMDLTDILQMMGRAGRPAFDTLGVAIVYTKELKKTFYKHFLNVGFPVELLLHKVLDNHLGAEIALGTITTRQQAMDFLTWTFLYRRAHNNPTYYGIEDTLPHGVSVYLTELIDSAMAQLEELLCVVLHGDVVQPTPFLEIASYYYLSHMTVRLLVGAISRTPTFRHAVQWLANAAEYDELPTRHGEELINAELLAQLRFPMADMDKEFAWDPHVKTYLLLQCHFGRVDMPIADYKQDLVSMMDQAVRVVQAYIDVAAEMGYLGAALMLMRLMQCLKQGVWDDDADVSSLPGVQALLELLLQEVAGMGHKELTTLATKLKVESRRRKEFVEVCGSLPSGTLTVSQENAEEIQVVFQHHHATREFMHTPRFPKKQRELWFAVVSVDDELWALKRVGPAGKGDVRCSLSIPDELRGKECVVRLVNDCWHLDYIQDVKLM